MYVPSHQKKRFVIALKYEGEQEYRSSPRKAGATRLENKLPASTTGSLIEKVKVESLLQFIRSLLFSDNPQQQLHCLAEAVEEVFQLAPSKSTWLIATWVGWSQLLL